MRRHIEVAHRILQACWVRSVAARLMVSLVALACLPVVAEGRAAGAEPEISGDRIETNKGELVIHPIDHATFAMAWQGKTIYVDPKGGAKPFASLPRPDLILITDIHGDHLSADTVAAVRTDATVIVAPAAVAERLHKEERAATTVLANGQSTEVQGIPIEAVPMYNLTEERLKFHTKGRGNGYVLTVADKRVYISGDTEDIPEMRKLANIDVAFLCMNLPYTMSVEQAADAVRAFRPKIVYPYHHRGSDLEKFKSLVGDDLSIEVRIRDWYPE